MLATGRFHDIEHRWRPIPSIAMQLPHSPPVSEHFDTARYVSRRRSHGSDTEPKLSTPHRKRVPVACQRCRKRKIKCSGDEGNGSGCTNCKQASDGNACQFLRVDSFVTGEFPPASSRLPGAGSRYHPYASQRNCGYAHPSQEGTMLPSIPHPSWQRSQGFNPNSTTIHAYHWTRQPNVAQYASLDGGILHGHSQAPPYMLPEPEQNHALGLNYVSSTARQSQDALWLEQMNSVSVPQQSSQVLSSVYALTSPGSPKSYPLLDQSGPGVIGYEMPLPWHSATKETISNAPDLSDTPPPSAVSHRSLNIWQNDSTSTASYASNRVNHGPSQDPSYFSTNNIHELHDPRYEYNTLGSYEAALPATEIVTSHGVLQHGIYCDAFHPGAPPTDRPDFNSTSRIPTSRNNMVVATAFENTNMSGENVKPHKSVTPTSNSPQSMSTAWPVTASPSTTASTDFKNLYSL